MKKGEKRTVCVQHSYCANRDCYFKPTEKELEQFRSVDAEAYPHYVDKHIGGIAKCDYFVPV